MRLYPILFSLSLSPADRNAVILYHSGRIALRSLFETARAAASMLCGQLATLFESCPAAFNLFGPRRGKSPAVRYEGTDTICRVRRTLRPRARTSVSSTQETLGGGYASPTPIQVKVHFLGRALTAPNEPQWYARSPELAGGLSPFSLST